MSIDVERLARALTNVQGGRYDSWLGRAPLIAREYDRLDPAPSDALREALADLLPDLEYALDERHSYIDVEAAWHRVRWTLNKSFLRALRDALDAQPEEVCEHGESLGRGCNACTGDPNYG